MHTPRALCLGLLVLSGSSLAANRSKEFCAAWTKAASAGKDYQETLMATLKALGELGGAWERALGAVASAAPGDHLAILRGGAADLGEKFSCPTFEFPAGAQKSTVLLDDEQARGINAIRLTFAAGAPERVGPWIEAQYVVVSQGEVFALDGNQQWPGRRRLIRFKPGADSPMQVAFPVGETRKLAVDSKRVYWRDDWFEGLRAEPLKR